MHSDTGQFKPRTRTQIMRSKTSPRTRSQTSRAKQSTSKETPAPFLGKRKKKVVKIDTAQVQPGTSKQILRDNNSPRTRSQTSLAKNTQSTDSHATNTDPRIKVKKSSQTSTHTRCEINRAKNAGKQKRESPEEVRSQRQKKKSVCSDPTFESTDINMASDCAIDDGRTETPAPTTRPYSKVNAACEGITQSRCDILGDDKSGKDKTDFQETVNGDIENEPSVRSDPTLESTVMNRMSAGELDDGRTETPAPTTGPHSEVKAPCEPTTRTRCEINRARNAAKERKESTHKVRSDLEKEPSVCRDTTLEIPVINSTNAGDLDDGRTETPAPTTVPHSEVKPGCERSTRTRCEINRARNAGKQRKESPQKVTSDLEKEPSVCRDPTLESTVINRTNEGEIDDGRTETPGSSTGTHSEVKPGCERSTRTRCEINRARNAGNEKKESAQKVWSDLDKEASVCRDPTVGSTVLNSTNAGDVEGGRTETWESYKARVFGPDSGVSTQVSMATAELTTDRVPSTGVSESPEAVIAEDDQVIPTPECDLIAGKCDKKTSVKRPTKVGRTVTGKGKGRGKNRCPVIRKKPGNEDSHTVSQRGRGRVTNKVSVPSDDTTSLPEKIGAVVTTPKRSRVVGTILLGPCTGDSIDGKGGEHFLAKFKDTLKEESV